VAKSILKILAVLTLIAAFFLGLQRTEQEQLSRLRDHVPPDTRFQELRAQPLILSGENPDLKDFTGYYILTRANGWGGPLHIALIVDDRGVIKNILTLSHRETPSFFHRLERKKFFDQFKGKKIDSPLSPGDDIDTVTRATVSSRAFTRAVREGGHDLGRLIFDLRIPERKAGWNLGGREIFLLALIGAALAGLLRIKSRIWRWGVMAVAVVFLGFTRNASLSISHFGALGLGYLPSVRENPFWWILLGAAVLAPLALRRNLYCRFLCPFGNIQELNSKISGVNLPLGKTISRIGRALPYGLTWLALIIILYTATPALGAYEPFPTFFGLDGTDVQWYILAAVIIGSFFLSRFFCRFFCPVGVILNLLVRFRRRLDKLLKVQSSCPK